MRANPERALIVGLGGGAMVHFLQHYDPELAVDVVEIDPAVVKIADRYINVRPGTRLNVITADGLRYLRETETRYDVIYMDAFLKPSPDTDATGLPLNLKTGQFYRDVQGRLGPEGLVVVNLNRHKSVEADIRTIRGAFRQTYVFRPPVGNVIVVASTAETRIPKADLHARAKQIDHRFKASFSFEELVNRLRD